MAEVVKFESGDTRDTDSGRPHAHPHTEYLERLRQNYHSDAIRTFETGATRDTDSGKFDYEGFLSPLVLERFAEYMHKHRVQPTGSLRDSDNWQRGMPLPVYLKSLFRHFVDLWKEHRGIGTEAGIEAALCAVLFNAQGYLHEILKAKRAITEKPQT